MTFHLLDDSYNQITDPGDASCRLQDFKTRSSKKPSTFRVCFTHPDWSLKFPLIKLKWLEGDDEKMAPRRELVLFFLKENRYDETVFPIHMESKEKKGRLKGVNRLIHLAYRQLKLPIFFEEESSKSAARELIGFSIPISFLSPTEHETLIDKLLCFNYLPNDLELTKYLSECIALAAKDNLSEGYGQGVLDLSHCKTGEEQRQIQLENLMKADLSTPELKQEIQLIALDHLDHMEMEYEVFKGTKEQTYPLSFGKMEDSTKFTVTLMHCFDILHKRERKDEQKTLSSKRAALLAF